jgi:hypothetical protein
MSENIEDLKEFRRSISDIFDGDFLSDRAIINKVKRVAENNDILFEISCMFDNPKSLKVKIKELAEFRDRVKSLLHVSPEVSDPDSIGFIEYLMGRYKRWERDHEVTQFALEVKQLLIDLVGKDISNDEAIAEIKRLQANQNRSDKTILDRLAEQEEFEKAPRYDPQEVSEICDDSDHKSAKDREIERLLSEIVDILNKANAECLDHYRSKQEEKIVLTGFRRLCDIHAALFKKRSEYEIYGSRIINDLLNSVNLQAQKHAYDQEEIKRIDKNEEAIAKIEQLTGDKDREIERLNRCLSSIASFLDLPSGAKQLDIIIAIMELRQEKKKYYKGYFQLEVISKYLKLPENCKPMDITTEVIELKEELDQAKKIIARLVGE